MRFSTLNNLLVHELRDLFSAENQLLDALPSMARAASNKELKEAFNDHLQETREQVNRLQSIFDRLKEKPGGEHCEAMEGLVEEGNDIIEAQGEPHVKDAALIAAAQRVEHYEIAGYGTAHAFAEIIGDSDSAQLLKETLQEEKAADKKLNKLATGSWLASGVNQEAPKR